MSTLVIIVLVCCWNWIKFEKFQLFWKKKCVNLPNKWVKLINLLNIFYANFARNAFFSGKNYTTGKNLHDRRSRQFSSLLTSTERTLTLVTCVASKWPNFDQKFPSMVSLSRSQSWSKIAQICPKFSQSSPKFAQVCSNQPKFIKI